MLFLINWNEIRKIKFKNKINFDFRTLCELFAKERLKILRNGIIAYLYPERKMINMIQYHHVNGVLTEVEKAQLHVSDLAILRGFGVFDYFKALKGKPLFVEDYVDRFFNSASLLYLAPPCTKEELIAWIQDLLDANGQENAGIRLVLTGGYAPDSYTPIKPNLLILQHPYADFPDWGYEKGIKILTYHFQREIPVAKTINYVTGIRIQGWLKENGGDAVLYHDGTHIKESDRSNFFMVDQKGQLVTPQEEVLLGITRKKIIAIAKEKGLTVIERMISLEEIYEAKEAFITSSIKGVLPVVQIDDKVIGHGKPGLLSKTLGEAFKELTLQYCQNHASI